MAWRRSFAVVLSVCLLGEGFCAPAQAPRLRRADGLDDNEVTSKELTVAEEKSDTTTTSPITSASTTEAIGRSESSADSSASGSASPPDSPSPPASSDDDDDDDDFADLPAAPAGGGGGSNLFSLLNLAGSLFPSSSGNNVKIRKMIKEFLIKYQHVLFTPLRPRKDVRQNEIEIDYDLKPPKLPTTMKLNIQALKPLNIRQSLNLTSIFKKPLKITAPIKQEIVKKPLKDVKPIRQEIEESEESEESESEEQYSSEELSEENDAAEESVEDNGNGNGNGNGENGKQDESNGDNSDYDSDEPPGGGDGEGGGLLGLLAGLSGGEDGQSDLGSLLATVGGIIANLSGDGVDINALIASGLGLLVGLLSEGNENPGAVIASYLLTSLETLTEGGAKNNGAFIGSFISKLVKGTSAVPEGSSEEEGMMRMPMTDSAGFFVSLLTALLGEMSKGSSGGWR